MKRETTPRAHRCATCAEVPEPGGHETVADNFTASVFRTRTPSTDQIAPKTHTPPRSVRASLPDRSPDSKCVRPRRSSITRRHTAEKPTGQSSSTSRRMATMKREQSRRGSDESGELGASIIDDTPRNRGVRCRTIKAMRSNRDHSSGRPRRTDLIGGEEHERHHP